MRKIVIVAVSIGLIILFVDRPKPAAAQSLCTSFSNFTVAYGWSLTGTINDNYLIGELVDVNGTSLKRAMASYSIEAVLGEMRGVSSITYSWLYYGGASMIPGFATVAIQDHNRTVEARQQIGSVLMVPRWNRVTETFPNIPVDHLLVYAEVEYLEGIEQMIAINVSEICYYSRSATPTPAMTSTSTATRTETPTLTPSITYTPITLTPTESLTPVHSATPLTPTLDLTLDSGDFGSPLPPDNECRDVLNPCPLFPVPVFEPIDLPSPTGMAVGQNPSGTPMPSLTPLPTFTMYPTGDGSGNSDLRPISTHVSELSDSLYGEATRIVVGADGNPADIPNSAHEIGLNIGTLFGLARTIQSADLGRVGGVISFLILLIAFNIALRLLLFAVPIIAAFFRLILWMLTALAGVIKALRPF
jgi:hypothetical protein